ncbi:MAG: 5-formyltetrahydrofolate cyclo-ligase [Cellvibrionales bacterium TMED148]|nr:5-formyltetrahydrofolate cyclo-ligase [Porticoccaceae bacterium]RPG88665.1 MAG: 5-formyltetrahydrofolate cyclo-ligase [Cellvibrionales bacterium TMED148]
MNPHADRHTMRNRRRAMSSRQQNDASQSILKKIREQNILDNAKRVAIYFATDGEINPLKMPRCFYHSNRNWYLPRLNQSGKKMMDFALFTADTKMAVNKFGILEPSFEYSEGEPANKMDIIFLPLVGFDRNGNRLGMGGGYYDSTLAFANQGGLPHTMLVGLAHHFQEKPQLSPRIWDVKLDMIITDQEIICVKPK